MNYSLFHDNGSRIERTGVGEKRGENPFGAKKKREGAFVCKRMTDVMRAQKGLDALVFSFGPRW